jgi:DNA-binding NarL/FixJ family response regulator
MARVLALTGDLLFGSRVQGALALAGHDVELIADERRLRDRLADPARPEADVLVVDLTDGDLDGAATVQSLSNGGQLGRARTLGFYSHVDAPARERAERAGFDLVVPRSRMAREGVELVERLLEAPRPAPG